MPSSTRPKPLLVTDWGNNSFGPRYTEINGERTWHRRRDLWHDTQVGYILHRPMPDGRLVPFVWRTHRNIPRPPRKKR